MLILDIFHMIYQITKIIMHLIRKQLSKERFELKEVMTLFGTKWNDWYLIVWI